MTTQIAARERTAHEILVGDRRWTAAAAIVALALASPGLRAPISNALFDAGITASAGTWMLHGLVPYRDFWLLYGPLAGAVAAVLTGLFGHDVAVLRLSGLAVLALSAGAAQALLSRWTEGPIAAVVAVLALTIPVVFTGLDLSSWNLAVLFGLLATLASASRERRLLVVSGVLCGLAGLARLDLGAYVLVAIVLTSRSLRPVLGAAIVIVPVGLLLLATVPLPVLIDQLVWFPVVVHPEYRSLPAPAVLPWAGPGGLVPWALYWIPLVLIGGALLQAIRARSLGGATGALLVMAILWRTQTLVRPDDFHLAEAGIPAMLLAGLFIRRPSSRPATYALAAVAAVCLGVAIAPVTWLFQPRDPYDAALSAAVDAVRSATAPSEPIFVGEVRNRYTWANPLLAYALADRPPGVRDTMYNPGVTNTDDTQRRMAADLRDRAVRYLILDVRYADCRELSNQSRNAGSTILDVTIAQDYRVVADLGAIVIMVRRDVPSAIVAPAISAAPDPPPSDGNRVCDRSDPQP